jgi:TRAP-type C4-dicarboxylate transport system permease small subunit
MTAPRDRGLRFINAVASALLACAVVLMAAQVLLRFGFHRPQPWAEEINRYCFVWATYLGAILAVAKGTHIRVTVLTDALPDAWRRRFDRLDWLVWVVVAAHVAVFSALNVWEWRFHTFFTIPSLPQALFSLSVPVCMVIMLVYLLRRRPSQEPPTAAPAAQAMREAA